MEFDNFNIKKSRFFKQLSSIDLQWFIVFRF